jgi:hypothetical protein
MKENIIVMIYHRIKSLIRKILSLTFLTWLIITYLYWYNKQIIDVNYLLFTAAMSLGKSFVDIQKSKTGGV